MSYIVRYNGEVLMLCNHKHKSEEAKNKCLKKTYAKLKQLEAAQKKAESEVRSDGE